jgi:alkylhydroperoxidase/carboxymuconolactone decarboxylase family protein YurZ
LDGAVDVDRRRLRSVTRSGDAVPRPTSLDSKTDALVRIGALIAIGAVPSAYDDAVRCARVHGASANEVVDTLIAVSTTVGMARVVVASDGLSRALGYDIDAALEGRTPDGRPTESEDSPA